MPERIHASYEIATSPGISQEMKDFLLRYSVAVNTLSMPFYPANEEDLIKMVIQHESKPISQIAIAYEVPPYFTRKGQYFTEDGIDHDVGMDTIDKYTPGLFGVSSQHDGSLGIILFMRGNILEILGDEKFITGSFEQFLRLESLIEKYQPNVSLGPFSMVGVLSGRVIKRGVRFPPEYARFVEMCKETNANSARFVVSAVQKVLIANNLDQSNLVILGSRGALGSEIAIQFPDAQGIDLHNKEEMKNMTGTVLILDCSTGKALQEFIDGGLLVSGVKYIWLNESFPTPSAEDIDKARLSGRDIKIFHIQGLGAQGVDKESYMGLLPSFPVYGNTRPCCMGSKSESVEGVKIIELL